MSKFQQPAHVIVWSLANVVSALLSKLGLSQVPVIIITASDEALLAAQLIENLQRQNLTPLDEGRAIQQLMDHQKLSVRAVAELLGKNRGYVENRVRLLKMDADLQEMVSSRDDTLKHAQLISGIAQSSLRAELIRLAVEEDASVAELKRIVEGGNNQPEDNISQSGSLSNKKVSSRDDTPAKKVVHNADNLEALLKNASTQLDLAIRHWERGASSTQYATKDVELLLSEIDSRLQQIRSFLKTKAKGD